MQNNPVFESWEQIRKHSCQAAFPVIKATHIYTYATNPGSETPSSPEWNLGGHSARDSCSARPQTTLEVGWRGKGRGENYKIDCRRLELWLVYFYWPPSKRAAKRVCAPKHSLCIHISIYIYMAYMSLGACGWSVCFQTCWLHASAFGGYFCKMAGRSLTILYCDPFQNEP